MLMLGRLPLHLAGTGSIAEEMQAKRTIRASHCMPDRWDSS